MSVDLLDAAGRRRRQAGSTDLGPRPPLVDQPGSREGVRLR